jgi:hypothetical protein
MLERAVASGAYIAPRYAPCGTLRWAAAGAGNARFLRQVRSCQTERRDGAEFGLNDPKRLLAGPII